MTHCEEALVQCGLDLHDVTPVSLDHHGYNIWESRLKVYPAGRLRNMPRVAASISKAGGGRRVLPSLDPWP